MPNVIVDSTRLLFSREMFSREETATLLCLSIHTVARDCRNGRIKTRRYGRRVLIPRSEILRIANEGMHEEAATS